MPYDTVEFPTAAGSLEYLRPSKDHWISGDPFFSPWVFRGHADARWPLLPKAWREDGKRALAPLRARNERAVQDSVARDQSVSGDDARLARILEAELQTVAEMDAIGDFEELVDALGHPIPGQAGDSPLHEIYRDGFPARARVRAPHDILVGFAQHHGIPTRALDFTRNPVVAAFFCADQQVGESATNVAVWALAMGSLFTGKCELKLLRCPRSAVSFLHAQDALFVFSKRPKDHFLEHGRWPALEEIAPDGALRKLLLPRSELADLQRRLWLERITRAHLMPTYDNVSAALNQKWQLERGFYRRDASGSQNGGRELAHPAAEDS